MKLEDLGRPLPEDFYRRPAAEVARECLGKVLAHGETAGRIVEVEAYLGVGDRAAHAWRGSTPRTAVLFGPPGRAYIYLVYGMYHCLNFVAEPEGSAGCVLIRALEPTVGIEAMRNRRPAAEKEEQLASGPGKLTIAMGIGRGLNGSSLVEGPIRVFSDWRAAEVKIEASPRIGITHCADWPLRFSIAGNASVSGRPKRAPRAI